MGRLKNALPIASSVVRAGGGNEFFDLFCGFGESVGEDSRFDWLVDSDRFYGFGDFDLPHLKRLADEMIFNANVDLIGVFVIAEGHFENLPLFAVLNELGFQGGVLHGGSNVFICEDIALKHEGDQISSDGLKLHIVYNIDPFEVLRSGRFCVLLPVAFEIDEGLAITEGSDL